MRFGILTVSTSCFHNPEKDLAGPKLEAEIKTTFLDSQVTFKQIVSDDKQSIVDYLNNVTKRSACDVMFTVGGTGFTSDDVTPEATKAVIDKDAPGLVHALISRSLAVTEMAMLSRPVCGIKNKTIIINLPGSPKAAVECFGFIKNSLLHAVALLSEEQHKVQRDHEQIQQELSFNGSGDSKVKIKAGAARIRQSLFPMLEVTDAKDLIFKTVPAIEETEEIYIEDALGRVLAEDIRAANPVPAFPASIKDGYAVKASDGAGKRTVRSVTAAGDAPECTVVDLLGERGVLTPESFTGRIRPVSSIESNYWTVYPYQEQSGRRDAIKGTGSSARIAASKLVYRVKIKVGVARIRQSLFPMLEVTDAKDLIFKTVPAIEETEEIYIEDALGRVLAEDIRAANPVPAFPASIKDGYAVKASDGAGKRTVRSVTAAGDAPECTELQHGEVIRISTGAAVPAGADAVVQVEDTSLVEISENGEEEKTIDISVAPKVGQDIRQVGSDIQANALVLQKHNPISSACIGVLAMLGIAKIKVIKRPFVGVVSTGNELVDYKETLKPGLVYDSNKVTLLTLLKSYGYDAWDCGIARDRPNSVKAVLEKAFEKCDIIVSSGGVSMSEFDLVKQVLVEDFNATIHFGRLNMKPGKPTVFATLDYKGKTKFVFALPGNPVSCCVTSLLFVIPTLKYMENNKAFKGWPTVSVILDHNISNGDSRPEYVRLKISSDNKSQLIANSTGNQISSRLNSMVDANGLLLVPGKTELKKGVSVTAYLFGQIF